MTNITKQLAEALELALSSHGVTLLSDPPQDAWKARGVERIGRAALAAYHSQQSTPCDMGEICLGCEPRREDGGCPAAPAQPVAMPDELAAFKAELKKMPEWAPEYEQHRAWVEMFAWNLWLARARLSAQAAPKVPDNCGNGCNCLAQCGDVEAYRREQEAKVQVVPVAWQVKTDAGMWGQPFTKSALAEEFRREGREVRALGEVAAVPHPPQQEERKPLTQAAADVLAERQRQISAEGWTPEHDDRNQPGTMATAAACYALASHGFTPNGEPPAIWPWDTTWWKPSRGRRDLIKAGALILAEIERLDRAGIRSTGGKHE